MTTPKQVWNIYKTNLGIFLKSPWGTYNNPHHMSKYRVDGVNYENAEMRNGYIFLKGIGKWFSATRLKEKVNGN